LNVERKRGHSHQREKGRHGASQRKKTAPPPQPQKKTINQEQTARREEPKLLRMKRDMPLVSLFEGINL